MQVSINLAQLQELRELLDDEFDSLIQAYIVDSQIRLNSVQYAYEQNDNSKGYEAIHSLKGASANIGAIRLAELCLKLQMECKAGRISSNDLLIQMIHEEQQQISDYLSGIVQ